jgi:uncharacterized protein (TIGR03437 family)
VYLASRPLLNLVLAPLSATFAANAVVNAATFTSGIAPGGLMSIFGTGLSGGAVATTVDFDGATAPVISASPFQVNAQVPVGLAPGLHTLHVKSAFGTAQQQVNVPAVAPAIFLVGNPPVGALVNPDGGLNGPTAPIQRGQVLLVYATGLGATVKQGQYSVTSAAVTVLLNGVELPVQYAGLAPGYPGLNQINLLIPATTPPGSGITLSLKEAGQISNAVSVAIQ